MRLTGTLEQVETYQARAFAAADAVSGASVVYVDRVEPLLTEVGTITVDINGTEYTATPTADDVAPYITVSPVLAADVDELDPVTVVPAAEVKWATVSFPGGDDQGDPTEYRVPLNMVALAQFADGPKNGDDERVAVEVETDDTTVVGLPNGPTTHDATTTPIIVRTRFGESIRIDGDGLSAYTDNAILLGSSTPAPAVLQAVVAGTTAYVRTSSLLGAYDILSGGELNPPWPPTSATLSNIATNGTHVFGVDASSDIAKFDATSGATVAGGFPIAGTFTKVTADAANVFAIDSSADIRKYAAGSGTQNLSGFPIAGTFTDLAVDDTHLYLVQSGDIYKYDKVTGVQDTNGFPIAGTFTSPTCDGDYVYAIDPLGDVYRFSTIDGVQVSDSGYPIEGLFTAVSSSPDYLVAFAAGTLFVYNNTEGSQSFGIDSGTGSASGAVGSFDRIVTKEIGTDGAKLDINGPVSASRLGHSDQKVLSADANPTSTTNVNMTSLNMTASVTSTSDVVWVEIDAEIVTAVANSLNTVELLIDGSANAVQLRTRLQSINDRYSGHKKWRITGLAAGSHTIAFRTRNSAGSTDVTITAGHTVASYWTST